MSRSAALSLRSAKKELRRCLKLLKRMRKIERDLAASVSIGSQTPHTAARELARLQCELDRLRRHEPARSASCCCAPCQVARARARVDEAKEALSVAREASASLEQAAAGEVLTTLRSGGVQAAWDEEFARRPAWTELLQLTLTMLMRTTNVRTPLLGDDEQSG